MTKEASDCRPERALGHHSRNEWKRETYLSLPLFIVVSILLGFVVVLLSWNLYFQHENYQLGVQQVLRSGRVDHAVLLTYSRSWDFAVVKTSSVFLAFSLVLIGALYVLRVAGSKFSLMIENVGTKGTLETSSPGLVMLALGVLLVIFVLHSKSTVELSVAADKVDNSAHTMKSIPPPGGGGEMVELKSK